MLRLRPYPGMTIACAILFAILCGLGVWQVQRLHWKLGLIATINRQMHMRPVDLNQPGKLHEEPETDYAHVTVTGRFDNSKEVYLFAGSVSSDPGYHVLTPLITDGGRAYLVDRGFVPREKLDPATRPQGQPGGEVRVTGVWRWPAGLGPFTPSADTKQRVWYWRDLAGIAALDRLHFFQPGIIEADAAPNPGGWPKGGQTIVDLPNNHLSYAFTWFGLAAGLFCVWLAYHVSKGRIGWR